MKRRNKRAPTEDHRVLERPAPDNIDHSSAADTADRGFCRRKASGRWLGGTSESAEKSSPDWRALGVTCAGVGV